MTSTHRRLDRTAHTAIFGSILALYACGSAPNDQNQELPGEGSTEETIDVTNPDSATSLSDSNWCAKPIFDAGARIELDKETFVQSLADYSTGWWVPLHEVLLQLDEGSLFRSSIDMVRATYETQCRYEEDVEFLPPGEDLLDEQNQQDFHDAIVDFFAEAEVVESGQRLRLSFHECSECGETLGEEPVFLNVEMTASGALLLEVELEENETWTRTAYVTPNVMAVQAPLAPLKQWGDTASEDLRSGEVVLPDVAGTATVIARKDAQGHMSMSVGLSELSFVSDPGGPDEIIVTSHSECMGFGVELGPEEEGSELALRTGSLDASLPGSSHCPSETSCGAKERAGPFDYHVGDVALSISQPPTSSSDSLGLTMSTEAPSTASVAGEEFARGGLGSAGEEGAFTAAVQEHPDHFIVTFSPSLDMGAAMAISNFSDEMRMELPEWLADEIFDLTFGGDPVASVRVPVRELCPEGGSTEVERREVRIESGSGKLQVGGGRVLEASAGQCVGQSLDDPATFTRTSDWWEAGFVCQ